MSAPDDPLDAVAGEYVLGTLDLRERTDFSLRLRDDETARAAVAAWENRFASLRHGGAEIVAPPDVWRKLERAIAAPGAPSQFRVIDGGGRGSGADRLQLLRSRDRWRLGALASGGLAAALVAFVAMRAGDLTRLTSPDATYVAAVNRGGDKPALIVSVDFRTRTVQVRPVAAKTPEGHSLELWYIGAGTAPRSMGLVRDVAATLPLPGGEAPDGSATFAVSVEPPGGSKTGGPTGAVVYSGQLVKD